MTTQRYYSNIYWHFTGSPEGIDWHQVRCPADIIRQGPKLKPATEAKETLKAILSTQKLQARCTEKVVDSVQTAQFCCVTDIPLKDLPSHAPYYGKVAIGFKASAIHRSFLPVIYISTENMPTIEMMIPNRQLTAIAHDFLTYQGAFAEQQAMKLLAQADHNKEAVKQLDADAMRGFLMNFVKVTDFDTTPENTFYREREWRNLGDFSFTVDDVDAIVVPESFLGDVREHLDKEGYPPSVSALAWEFIENA